MKRRYIRILPLAMAIAMVVPTMADLPAAQAAVPTSYTFSPSLLGANASLAPRAARAIILTVRSAAGKPIPWAIVYLSFAQTAGGGSAQTWHGPLTATPQPI